MPPKRSQAAKAKAKKDEKASNLPERSKREEVKADKMRDAQEKAEPENNGAVEEPAPEPEEEDGDAQEPEPESKPQPDTKKRKTPPTKAVPKEKKVPRQGSRTSSRTTGGGGGADKSSTSATPKQILNFLLSKDSLPYCYPADELDAAKKDKNLRTYSLTSPSTFTPFEHLIIAHLLSKPLSHTLGMRSIRTLLNPPFSLNTPERIVEAGEKRVWEALEAARTQHRQKTANYIFEMANAYIDDPKQGKEAMYELAVEANEDGANGVVQHIKKTVKGMGVTGGELFCRRIQCVDGWGDAVWPYADARSFDSLKQVLGIDFADADELQEMIEGTVDWDLVADMGLNKVEEKVEVDMELQVQVEFVVALERAVGCALEAKVEELKSAAAASKR